MTTMSNVAQVRQILAFLHDVRSRVKDNITVQELQTLLTVYMQPEITQTQIQELTGSGVTTVSKHVADFGRLTARKEAGPDLLEQIIDPMNQRQRIVKTTIKGQKLLDSIMETHWRN